MIAWIAVDIRGFRGTVPMNSTGDSEVGCWFSMRWPGFDSQSVYLVNVKCIVLVRSPWVGNLTPKPKSLNFVVCLMRDEIKILALSMS